MLGLLKGKNAPVSCAETEGVLNGMLEMVRAETEGLTLPAFPLKRGEKFSIDDGHSGDD